MTMRGGEYGINLLNLILEQSSPFINNLCKFPTTPKTTKLLSIIGEIIHLEGQKKKIFIVTELTWRNSLSSSVVGGDCLSKLKLKQGLGDSWYEDLGDSTEKEAGDRLELGVETSR